MIHKEVHATAYLYPLVSVKLAWVGMDVLYKVHRPPQKVDDRSGVSVYNEIRHRQKP